MLVLRNPALPVFIVGFIAECVEILALRRGSVAESVKIANLPLLSTLFALALGVASLARVWNYPAHVMSVAGTWATGFIGAGAANVINNLPAAALLSSKLPAHPYQLLLGLDLDPISAWLVRCRRCSGYESRDNRRRAVRVDLQPDRRHRDRPHAYGRPRRHVRTTSSSLATDEFALAHRGNHRVDALVVESEVQHWFKVVKVTGRVVRDQYPTGNEFGTTAS